VFGTITCPRCGAATEARCENPLAGQFGLAGVLLIYPFLATQTCPEHGELDHSTLPPEARQILWARRLAGPVGAGVVITLAVAVLIGFP
jgi:hypothetical protein